MDIGKDDDWAPVKKISNPIPTVTPDPEPEPKYEEIIETEAILTYADEDTEIIDGKEEYQKIDTPEAVLEVIDEVRTANYGQEGLVNGANFGIGKIPYLGELLGYIFKVNYSRDRDVAGRTIYLEEGYTAYRNHRVCIDGDMYSWVEVEVIIFNNEYPPDIVWHDVYIDIYNKK